MYMYIYYMCMHMYIDAIVHVALLLMGSYVLTIIYGPSLLQKHTQLCVRILLLQ